MKKFCRVGVILGYNWYKMQQEQLIEKVRQYQFLYNVYSAQYRDQNMRHEAWEEIGRDLKITALKAKDTWSKLRNCHSNALKRRNAKKSRQAAKKYVPWKFKKQMAFLQPYLDSRPTLGNLSQSDNASQLSEERSQMGEKDIDDEPVNAEDEGNDIEPVDYSSLSSPSTSNAENTSQSRPRSVTSPSKSNADNISQSRPQYRKPPQRKKPPNPAEELVDIMKKNSELRMQRSADKVPNNLNETDMFHLSMSKTIQKLPQLDQIRIRMEMCRLVSEADMHRLQTTHHNQILTLPQPASSQPASRSQMHTQPPIYHTLTPVQPNSRFQSQTPTFETHCNETELVYPVSASAWR